MTNKQVQTYKSEAKEAQFQVKKLLDELREKSDSESYEDEEKHMLNVSKAMQTDQLKEKIKIMQCEITIKEHDFEMNMKRVMG